MKKKITISIFVLLQSVFSLFGQLSNYYYYKGQKEFLSLDRSRIGIVVDKSSGMTLPSLKSSIPFTLKTVSQTDENSNNDFKLLEFSQTLDNTTYLKFISDLQSSSGVRTVQPCFLSLDTHKQIMMSDYLYVKLKDESGSNALRAYSQMNSLEVVAINKYMPLWYTLKCTKDTPNDCLSMANILYQSGYFAAATPDFMSDDLFCSNDPLFANQWGLKNESNLGTDISVCDAWDYVTGKGIKIAIIDQGIELTHNDLRDNIYSLSYDSETGTSPSRVYGDHGTHCAGIAGAVNDNNLQIAGVAPGAKLVSVSNSLYGTPDSRMKRADAINWAWMNGADILSNSWGSSVKFEAIDDAIDNALTKGRNGKGSVVCFAAGNDYGAVAYPANSNPDILVVGSIASTGKRSDFSNYGNSLDVVAPGSNILSTVLGHGTDYKNGTSMACPHVAGIAALLLEKNANLTAKQVNDIIERNAKKIGDLLSTDREIEVFAEKTEKYKLEVIAEKDNYTCYAETVVNPAEGIISLSPNPTSGEVTIKFAISNFSNSVIKISSIDGSGYVYEYPISKEETSKTINTSNYKKGIYTVTLISEGNVVDTKKLVTK